MVDEHLNHRWNEQRMGNAETLDSLRDCFRGERLDNRIRAGVEQHAVHAAAVGKMKHRCRVEIERIRRINALGEQEERARHQVAMAQHDALRTPGRAAGIKNSGKIIPARHCVGDRFRCRDP
jgi:hypothetical protein